MGDRHSHLEDYVYRCHGVKVDSLFALSIKTVTFGDSGTLQHGFGYYLPQTLDRANRVFSLVIARKERRLGRLQR
jgi:hypothetical protein